MYIVNSQKEKNLNGSSVYGQTGNIANQQQKNNEITM